MYRTGQSLFKSKSGWTGGMGMGYGGRAAEWAVYGSMGTHDVQNGTAPLKKYGCLGTQDV